MIGKRFSTALVALAWGATLSACGSGGVQTTVGAATHAHLSGPPINLMVASDLSSPAAIPETPTGAEARVAALNAAGGIDGRPVHLIVCDDSEPSPTACARRAVAAHVAAVVGSMSAGIDPILLANGIPQIGNVPFVPGDFTAPNSFPLFGFVTVTGGIIKQLAAAGCHRIAPLVLSGESSGDAANHYLHLAQASTPGVTVLPEVPVPFNLPDLSAQLAKAASDGSDCIAGVLFSADVSKILIEAQEQGIDEKFGFGESSVPQTLVSQLKGAADGIDVTGAFRPLSSTNPAVQQFKAEMGRYEPHGELDNYSENSWAAVKLFEIAAARASERYHAINAKTIYATMKTLSNINLGICAPVSFTHPGPLPGAPRVFNTDVFFNQVRNGQIIEVGSGPHSAL